MPKIDQPRSKRDRIHTKWLTHLNTAEEQGAFKEALMNDGIVLGRLLAILKEMAGEIEREEVSPSTFDNPAWAYKQAYSLGRMAENKKILQLIEFLEKE